MRVRVPKPAAGGRGFDERANPIGEELLWLIELTRTRTFRRGCSFSNRALPISPPSDNGIEASRQTVGLSAPKRSAISSQVKHRSKQREQTLPLGVRMTGPRRWLVRGCIAV